MSEKSRLQAEKTETPNKDKAFGVELAVQFSTISWSSGWGN
ncbi:hypothetical protein FPSE_11532 [Fusarium pseudograminearum CS3096]|uniref:Uncharacterized protein n=1 Tax=Fusarium pseudograminearum (strain CS3096) TaxID=1028729 RepID=K3V8S1_FUSPC|nr:hypothetical protein FPSE_11532 [Fusarium pseudograminearum CS3096]EKJ68288.1 hypothetical protein FPSE_11532 [Fusarium pseudograminearum CS3096]